VELAGLAGDALGDDLGVFVDQNAHLSPISFRQQLTCQRGHDLLGGFFHGVGRDDRQTGIGQHLLAQVFVGALHAHDQRHASARPSTR
jgi:hypothetical protein